MAKFEELAYDIREAVKAFSDDTELDNRYILYLYNIKRAKYLKQDLNNYQKTIDNSIKQTFCLDLEVVSANECSLDYDCGTILRSTKKIPTPIEMHTKVAITSIKPSNKISTPFNFISKDKAAYVANAPYARSLYAFLDTDGYIYVYSGSESYQLLDCISVTGVFEDPISLKDYATCCGCDPDTNSCFDIDTFNYPLQPNYIDLIREEIVREVLRKIQVPEDKINDSTD